MLLKENSNKVILCCPDEHLGLGCMRGDAGSFKVYDSSQGQPIRDHGLSDSL